MRLSISSQPFRPDPISTGMLEIDKSLEELKVYLGITPCPADFDDY
ncbi:MAG: hypothetical protein JHC85_13715 [Chthoniobacterales bacterium]|nr:hypothetical protein [Chthoniobacterales bacterium]